MGTNKITTIITFITLLFTGCKTEDISLKILDEIQPATYYPTDIVSEQFTNIYGIWKVTRTSGGFAGNGYKNDFDYLILKKNAIFGIVRNGSLIAYGKLTLLPDVDKNISNGVYCKFDFEKPATVELNADPVKYIRLSNKDSLNLDAPCCDRYNTHFIREE